MALAITATGTIAALPVSPYNLRDEGQTVMEDSIPRAAYDARTDVLTGLDGFEELNQFVAIISSAYAKSPVAVIAHLSKMLNRMLQDRNTGEG